MGHMNGLRSSGAAWVAAFGTVMSAVGSTPFKKIEQSTLESLNLWGNVLQAAGNALQADQEPKPTLTKFGNQIQATGNVTVVSGMVIDLKKETQEKLIITGNWFQATGGLLAVADEIENNPPNHQGELTVAMNVIGNLLSSIGNSLQAIGGIEQLKGNEQSGEFTNTTGSWIQAVGSVISAMAASNINENN